ncbi:MAG: winged helix-turn-helix transcriptional regulator [Calditrichaeota bacterium]|nr:winged helix-turn-helix transcriptional regulator [Calditrichota bacterium]
MDYVSVFKALGDETRLRIVNLFVQSGERLCVCEMVDSLQLPQYTVSKALGILRNAGLLRSGRQGTWVYNFLNDDSEFLRSFFELLKKHLAEQYPDDPERLKKRLFLRENGVCVVGMALNGQLEKEFQKRQKK